MGKNVTIVLKIYFNVDYYRIHPQTHRGIPLINRDTNTQVIDFRSIVLGTYSDTHWNYRNIEHENGLKMGPSV